MTTSDDLPTVANSLQTKLQTKLVVLPSVINTQQLHRHYSSHNTTASRLLQRMALPEQVTARYTAGVLQPEALRSPYQRFQRKESLDSNQSLVNASLVQRIPNSSSETSIGESNNFIAQQQDSTASIPLKQSYTTPISTSFSDPQVARFEDRAAVSHALSDHTTGTYRISRRINNFNGFSEGDTSGFNDSNAIGSPPNSASLPLSPQNAIADSSNTTFPSSIITPTQSANTIQPKLQSPIDNHLNVSESSSGLVYRVARKPIENMSTFTRSSINGLGNMDSFSTANSDLVLTSTTTNQGSLDVNRDKVVNTNQADVSIQRKYHQSELLMRPSQDARGALTRASENNMSNQTEIHDENTDVIRRFASNEFPISAIVQTKPLPLFRQNQVTEETTQDRGIPINLNSIDLPLAISPSHNAMISRQTSAMESVPAETISAIPTASVNASSANTGVDIGEIAERVSHIILRRLRVERERRGTKI